MSDRTMIQIGRLDVLLEYREVRLNGQPLHVGCRAYDILEILIEADGGVVSKDEIMGRVWPDTVVEENNLQVHISALRKMLGDDRDLIRTVPGRGYRLLATLSLDERAPEGHVSKNGPRGAKGNAVFPRSAVPLIGRDHAVGEIMAALGVSQVVTLVGAGGIGKTRLAMEIGKQMASQFPDGIVFVPLAAVSDTPAAFDALATALECKVSSHASMLRHLVAMLDEKRVLIVLDNCEQVLDAAAEMAEALAGASRHLRVLATSREALRTRDESVYSVPPLEVPGHESGHAEILQLSAVQLFLARACTVDPDFSCDPASVYLMGLVCRRLDGIPLAIELAAARAAVLGIDVLAANLDDRFRILTGGSRTALPRHQTLKATLDWSYRLLDETERKILRRLGIFANAFSFDAACRVVGDEASRGQVMNAMSGLVSKSLLINQKDGAIHRYRLLETTRAYALQQLDDHGERKAVALAHARYFRALFDRDQEGWGERPLGAWLADFRRELENLRTALEWSLSDHGDAMVGIELSAVTVPYWFDLSLVEEGCERARSALAMVEQVGVANVAVETRLKLIAALAAGLTDTIGPQHCAITCREPSLHTEWVSRAGRGGVRPE